MKKVVSFMKLFRELPIALMFLSNAVVVILWIGYDREVRERAEERAEIVSESYYDRIDDAFRDEFFILEYMTEEWENQGGISKEEWMEKARMVAVHYQFQAVELVEGTHVRWIVPLDGNEQAVDLDLSFEGSRDKAIKLATETGEVAIAGPIDLVQGGIGLLIFSPIFDGEERTGFTLGVVRVKENFSKLLDGLDEHGIVLESEGRVLYEGGLKDGSRIKKSMVVGGFELSVITVYQVKGQYRLLIAGLVFVLFFTFVVEFGTRLVLRGHQERETEEEIDSKVADLWDKGD
jgi:sensor domain CHASE-containing protein